MFRCLNFLFLFLLLFVSPANASLNISINFTTSADSNYSNSEKSLFQSAANFWTSIIKGYQDDIDRNWTLTVDSFSEAAQNGSVRLGSATASGFAISQFVANSNYPHGRFIYTTGGYASFNTHSNAGNLSETVIKHEIGHALGIGLVWEANEVYNDGDSSNNFSYFVNGSYYERYLFGGTPGQYMGEAGLNAYRNEFDPNALFIPVELDGSGGTVHGHWNEVADNPSSENLAGFDSHPGDDVPAPTVISGPNSGESFDDELMTGIKSGSAYLSQTSIESLKDIGYTIPESKTCALIFGCLALIARIYHHCTNSSDRID